MWIYLMPYMVAVWVHVVTRDCYHCRALPLPSCYHCRAPSGRALGNSCSRRPLHVAARWPPPPVRYALRS